MLKKQQKHNENHETYSNSKTKKSRTIKHMFFLKKNATAPAHPGKKAFEKMIPLGPQFHGINKNHQNPTKKMYFEKVAPEP